MNKLLTLFTAILFASISNAQYNKMIIGDNNNGRIIKTNLDGSNIVSLLDFYQSYYDADVDTLRQKIYMA